MFKKPILKFFLSLTSFSWFIVFLLPNLISSNCFHCISEIFKWKFSEFRVAVLIYFVITFLFFIVSWILLKIIKSCSNKSETLNAVSIKPAESSFLPTYIWLFVIALSLNDYSIMLYYTILLFILRIFLEKISYFNVFYLFLHYRFYEVTDDYSISYILITKRKDLKKNNIIFENLIRLNNFTFLEP